MCGLLVLAYHDKDELTTKDIANLENVARKAGYQNVESMVFQNSFLKLLPEAFGNHKSVIITRVVLPTFYMFSTFNIQVKASSWSQKMLLWVKAKDKLLPD